MAKICIVGDIILDVTLENKDTPLKMRLGGVVHSARALWAMDVDYAVAFFSPKYLLPQIELFFKNLGDPELIYLGEVLNSPYVILINEAKEIGNQGYEFLLRENIQISYNEMNLSSLQKFNDIMVISGSYETRKVLQKLDKSSKVSIDFSNSTSDYLIFEKEEFFFETIFISTSSEYFLNYCKNKAPFSIQSFFQNFKKNTRRVVLKENRGGSRAYDFNDKEIVCITSQTQPILHSVGVGDVYNVVTIFNSIQNNFEQSLNMASWIATEYALTTYPIDFKQMVERILKMPIDDIVKTKGIQLPWENREKINIYIAAPDFDFVDTTYIDLLCSSLVYHNFKPRRPIKENGQMIDDDSLKRKNELYTNDMLLMGECKMLVAVLLYNDPGTLIEIGIAAERKIPVLVFDPYNIAKNCMLTQTPNTISSNLDEIISDVFLFASKIS